MQLLIVDDDEAVRRLVTEHLTRAACDVTAVATAVAGLEALDRGAFDIAILDVALPDGSGLDLLRRLRQRDANTHVIILGGATNERDRVSALDLGADDYVVKPFFVRELTARVLAVGRHHDVPKDARLEYGPLAIDLFERQVTVAGAPLTLARKEYELLAFLATRSGHAFNRDELLRAVWRSAAAWQRPSTVTEHMRRLRSKIEADPTQPEFLHTVRGVGYRFDPPAALRDSPNRTNVRSAGSLVPVDG